MLNIFKKKNEILEAEVVVPLQDEEEELNPLSIPVRDIKQYLVDEFDRSRELELSIEQYELKEEEHFKTKTKYDATLVVVEEYKNRNEYLEDLLESQKQKYKVKLKEFSALEEEKNDLRIKLIDVDNRLNETDKFIVDGVNDRVLKIGAAFEDVVASHKGNLSKQTAINYLNDVIENTKNYPNNKTQ